MDTGVVHGRAFSPEERSGPGGDALLQRAVRCGLGWLYSSEWYSRRVGWAFAVLALLYFFCLATLAVGPINQFGNDVLLLLGGGWRILNGQVPHRDFYLALGPLEYMITAAGMWVTGGRPQGIAVADAAFGMTVGIWAWLLCKRRMTTGPALLVTAWLILTATCPTPLGSPATTVSCAMIYNRQGYALLGLVLVECAFVSERCRFWGGVSTGVALVLLAFLKLNFFGAGVLLTLATLPLSRDEMRRAWGILAGLLFTAVAFGLYLRLAIGAFLSDMSMAGHVRLHGFGLRYIAGELVRSADIVTAVILTVIAVLLTAPRKLWQKRQLRILLLGLLVATTGILVRQTDYGEKVVALVTLWTLVLIGRLAAAYPQAKEKMAISMVIALSLGSVATNYYEDARSMLSLLQYRMPSVWGTGVTLDGRQMQGLKFFASAAGTPQSGDSGPLYVAFVNDGTALLARSSTPQESVLALGFHNPFPYLLRRKPALGGGVWFLMDNNISSSHLLDAKQMFGNADLMMLPNYPSSHRQSDLDFENAYRGYLDRHFSFVARSQWWSLYRRKKERE